MFRLRQIPSDAGRYAIAKGHIVFVSSISAFTVSTNRAAYCISKAALSLSALNYAQRLPLEGILVFEIQPGIIRTDMIAALEQVYEGKIDGGLLPQRRMGEGRIVAGAVRAIANGHRNYCAGRRLSLTQLLS